MHAIGYDFANKGLCFGIASMVEQGLLNNNLEQIFSMIKIIDEHKGDFEEFYKGLSDTEQRKVTEEEKALRNNLHAFFDGIALYMIPRTEPSTSAPDSQTAPASPEASSEEKKDNRSIYAKVLSLEENVLGTPVQDLRKAEEIVRPLDKDGNLTTEIKTIDLPMQQFTNEQALADYLKMIVKYHGDQPFSLSLGNKGHAITLLYDPAKSKEKMIWFDPNGMDVSNEPITIQEVAQKIPISFDGVDDIFSTKMRITNPELAISNQAMLDKDTDWQKLIDIRKTRDIIDLFERAYGSNDTASCDKILAYLSEQQIDPYILYGDEDALNMYLYKEKHILLPELYSLGETEEKSYIFESKQFMQSYNKAIADDNLKNYLRYNPQNLKNASLAKQDDIETVKFAVGRDGTSIRHASPRLRLNKELALLALKNTSSAFDLIDDSLKQDKEILQQLEKTKLIEDIKQDVSAFHSASESQKEDVDVLQTVYQKSTTDFFKSAKLNLGNISALFRRDGFKVERLEDMIKFSEALSNPQDKSTFFNTYKTEFQRLIDNCHDIKAQLNSLQKCCPLEQNVVDLYSHLLSGSNPILEMDPSLFGNIIYTLPTDNAKNEFFKLCQDTLIEKMAPRNLTSLSNVPDKALRDGFAEVYFSKHKEQIVAEVVDSDYLEYALSNIPEVIREAAFQESVQGLSQKLIENDDLGKKLASYPEKYKLQLFEKIMPEISNDENKLLSLVTNLHGELQHRAFEQYMEVANDPVSLLTHISELSEADKNQLAQRVFPKISHDGTKLLSLVTNLQGELQNQAFNQYMAVTNDPSSLLAHASGLSTEQKSQLFSAVVQKSDSIQRFINNIKKLDLPAKAKIMAQAEIVNDLLKAKPELFNNYEAVKEINKRLFGKKYALDLPSTNPAIEMEKLKVILAMRTNPNSVVLEEAYKQLVIKAAQHDPNNFEPLKTFYESFLKGNINKAFDDLDIGESVLAMARQADMSAAMPAEADAAASPLEQEEHHANERHQAEQEAAVSSSPSPL